MDGFGWVLISSLVCALYFPVVTFWIRPRRERRKPAADKVTATKVYTEEQLDQLRRLGTEEEGRGTEESRGAGTV